MKVFKYFVFLLAGLLISGCATVMKVDDPGFRSTRKPIGIYICSSSEVVDDNDLRHRAYVINVASQTLSNILKQQGYTAKNLNVFVPHEKVFKKYFGAFYIDENVVAKIAKEKGCDHFLIAYYAYTNVNLSTAAMTTALFGVAGMLVVEMLIDGRKATTEDNLNVHSEVSLYGWLVRTEDVSVISSAHSPYISYNEYIEKNGRIKEPISKNYYDFYQSITEDMFGKL
jgi:hypothetical protein